MEPRNLLKPDFETSITFEPLGIFSAVFNVVLRRMSSVILYMCLYLHWGLFNADAISSLHFFEIDTRRKPVFWTLRNYVTNSRIWNDFQISSHYMTGCRINKFGIFTISWLRSVCMNVKIRNKFIEIKYSVSNVLVIFITNYWWFRILEISRYRRSNGSVLKDTRQVNKFNSFIYERKFYEMPFLICFRIDKWTESMLSITSNQEWSIVQLVIPIVEFISLSI